MQADALINPELSLALPLKKEKVKMCFTSKSPYAVPFFTAPKSNHIQVMGNGALAIGRFLNQKIRRIVRAVRKGGQVTSKKRRSVITMLNTKTHVQLKGRFAGTPATKKHQSYRTLPQQTIHTAMTKRPLPLLPQGALPFLIPNQQRTNGKINTSNVSSTVEAYYQTPRPLLFKESSNEPLYQTPKKCETLKEIPEKKGNEQYNKTTNISAQAATGSYSDAEHLYVPMHSFYPSVHIVYERMADMKIDNKRETNA